MSILRIVLILLLVLGCSAPIESTSEEGAPAMPPDSGGACYRSDKQHTPTDGACWRVRAIGYQPLDTCDGATPANQVLEQSPERPGPGYILTGFDLEPGACFYFYSCDGLSEAQATPTIEACP